MSNIVEAAKEGDLEKVKQYYLAKKENVNMQHDISNRPSRVSHIVTPIIAALERGHDKIVSYLSDKADIYKTVKYYYDGRHGDEKTITDAVCTAITNNSYSLPWLLRRTLMDNTINNPIAYFYSGFETYDEEAGEYNGFRQVLHSDMTYLHWAALKRQVEAVRMLLAFGANAKALTKEGKTASDIWPEPFTLLVDSKMTMHMLKNAKYVDVKIV